MAKETMTQFRCTINDCGKRFLRPQKLSYFLHLKEDHSATYKQNREYIDAKITVLKYEDPEFEDLSTNGLAF